MGSRIGGVPHVRKPPYFTDRGATLSCMTGGEEGGFTFDVLPACAQRSYLFYDNCVFDTVDDALGGGSNRLR